MEVRRLPARTSLPWYKKNCISQWAECNNMNLNPKKCKDVVICTLRSQQDLQPLLINNLPLVRVSCHKVVGLTLCDTLKWKENTNEIITKASKRLHILRGLKRAGVPSVDLICVYNALVPSVLEYSCVVWATSLPRYLVDQIERIQERTMRILFPGIKYQQALAQANMTSLEMRRDHLC